MTGDEADEVVERVAGRVLFEVDRLSLPGGVLGCAHQEAGALCLVAERLVQQAHLILEQAGGCSHE